MAKKKVVKKTAKKTVKNRFKKTGVLSKKVEKKAIKGKRDTPVKVKKAKPKTQVRAAKRSSSSAKKTKGKRPVRFTVSSKQTSGAGFVFEDKVAAYFLGHILDSADPFLDISGRVQEIHFQMRRNGWVVDDLLLVLSNGSESFKVAVSSKSNDQVNGNGLNNDSRREFWTTYLNIDSNVFDKDKDYLCLVVAPLRNQVSDTFSRILQQARHQSDDSFLNKLTNKTFSVAELTLLAGFQCPEDIASQHNVNPKELRKFLSRIVFLEFDFERQQSDKAKAIIDRSKRALVSGSNIDAINLYQDLSAVRDELAPHSGFVDYEKLVRRLRTKFNLKEVPQHQSDWNRIITDSQGKIAIIPDKIGGELKLNRQEWVDLAYQKLANNQSLFILGQSGFGKTILAKRIASEKLSAGVKVIWIDARSVENNFANNFHTIHSLAELVKIPDQEGFIFIDGIDRLTRSAEMQNLAVFLSTILYDSSPWKVIFTCQAEEYGQVFRRLADNNIRLHNSSTLQLSVSDSERLSILRAFPKLHDLLKHEHLKPIFNNLKYIDLLTDDLPGITSQVGASTLGESEIIDILWTRAISGDDDRDAERAKLLIDLAHRQATSGFYGIPSSEFQTSDLGTIPSLKAKKLVLESEDKFYFVHDLFGDWARFKLLRSKSNHAKQFILNQDLSSPLWARAIRLYGSYLLEQRASENGWLSFFKQFSENDPKEKLIQDILLESILYSSQTKLHLNDCYQALKENDAKLLIRFLELFLFRATIPNSRVIELSKDISGFSHAIASVIDRDMRLLYWPDVIEFLFEHRSEYPYPFHIELMLRNLTVIVTESWLNKTPNSFILREECAALALLNIQWLELQTEFIHDEFKSHFYKAILGAANELPEDVANIALRLTKRRRDSSEEYKTITLKGGEQRTIARPKSLYPEGPFEEIDSAFREVCLFQSGLLNLFSVSPGTVMEIILAMLGPAPRTSIYHEEQRAFLGFVEKFGEHDALYSKGPFLNFLRYNTERGIDIVLAVVAYAMKGLSREDVEEIEIEFSDRRQKFIGGQFVYFWFRDQQSTPYLLACSLMALEKHLLDLIDNGIDINPYIEKLYKESKSVAILGLLVSVGKRHPKLFARELRPLLSELRFYIWEHMNQASGRLRFFSTTNPTLSKLLHEWHSRQYRSIPLLPIAVQLKASFPKELKTYLESAAARWKIELAHREEDMFTYLSNTIIESFNDENYKTEYIDGKKMHAYQEPEHLTSESKQRQASFAEDIEITIFAHKCAELLNKGHQLTQEDLQVVWNKVTKFSAFSDANLFHYLNPKLGAIFGGLSLLVRFETVWLSSHASEREWIIEFIEKTIDAWSWNDIDNSQHALPDDWRPVCAVVLARLYSQDTSDTRIRRIVGVFLIKAEYRSLSVFTTTFANDNAWTSKPFVALQNLVIRRSQILVLGRDRQINQERLTTILKDFISEKFPADLIEWSVDENLSNGETTLILLANRVDSKLLTAMYWNLPTSYAQLRQKEVAHIAKVNNLLFLQLMYDWKTTDDYIVSTFDRHVVERIVFILLNSDGASQREYLWQPIIALGYNAVERVKVFLSVLFSLASADAKLFPVFVDTWKSILRFSSQLDSWTTADFGKRLSELRPALFGLTYDLIERWRTGNYNNFLDAIAAAWVPNLQHRFVSRQLVERIVYLIGSKAGEPLLKYMLPTINLHIQMEYAPELRDEKGDHVFQPYERNDELAHSLSFIWDNFKAQITGNASTFESYKKLVIHLVAKQNKVGLQLREQIKDIV
jgi:hypothetical protein